MAKTPDKKEYIYVGSGTGRPIHLLDRVTLINGMPMEISIDSRMIRENVALKVVKTTFVLASINEGLLTLIDKDEVKIDSETYHKKVEAEREQEEAESVEKQADNLLKSFESFQSAVEKSVKLQPTGKKTAKKKTLNDEPKL